MDSRNHYTKSDWEYFSAAVASSSTKQKILQAHASWVNEKSTDKPMADLHDTEGTGGFPGLNIIVKPVIGGHFAPLALNRACGAKAAKGLKWLDNEKIMTSLEKKKIKDEWMMKNDEL